MGQQSLAGLIWHTYDYYLISCGYLFRDEEGDGAAAHHVFVCGSGGGCDELFATGTVYGVDGQRLKCMTLTDAVDGPKKIMAVDVGADSVYGAALSVAGDQAAYQLRIFCVWS
jgi:hypothetical protein